MGRIGNLQHLPSRAVITKNNNNTNSKRPDDRFDVENLPTLKVSSHLLPCYRAHAEGELAFAAVLPCHRVIVAIHFHTENFKFK